MDEGREEACAWLVLCHVEENMSPMYLFILRMYVKRKEA